MHDTVLGSVTLGYEPLWDQARQRMGVRLWLDPLHPDAADAAHLLHAIQELWPTSHEVCLLQPRTPQLLGALLHACTTPSFWLEVPHHWLSDSALLHQVQQAQARGVALVWSGAPGERPAASPPPGCVHAMLSLSPEDALDALRLALRWGHGPAAALRHSARSPVMPGQLYESLASQALVEHALDQQQVHAVAGWPVEEMLYGYRLRKILPARQVVLDLLHAMDADASMDTLEHTMGHDPVLCYRFLRFANSVALGLAKDISSLRHGLITLGLSQIRAWLAQQLPLANTDANLAPVRHAMLVRARIMEHMADVGVEVDLRREVFLCGLFSQLDVVLGETMDIALHRLPLPSRVTAAVQDHSGPYAPWLEVATALEGRSSETLRALCATHQIAQGEVNRALLRALAQR